MPWPLRTSRSVTPLSSAAEGFLRASAAATGKSGRGASPVPSLRGDAKARLLAEFARRDAAPASRLRLLLGDIRWPAASLSAVVAAAAVLSLGSTIGGIRLSDISGDSGPAESLRMRDVAAPAVTPIALSPAAVMPSAVSPTGTGVGERALPTKSALAWERFHPLPASSPRVRVVDDQNLSLIGVGWTPDLDGP